MKAHDYKENHFFRFNEMYPDHQFACVEKLKKCKLPMLYYNDKIPDFELCKIRNEFEENEIDANTTNIPVRDKTEFPSFENRWNFFQDYSKNGMLHWDSERLMQNIQMLKTARKLS
jgi:hypothetical protein